MSSIHARTFTARTGQQFTIRTAQPDDAAALLDHVKTAAQQSDHLLTEPDEFTMTDVEERKWIQEHLDGPGNLCLLAEASGVIIGSFWRAGGDGKSFHRRGAGYRILPISPLWPWIAMADQRRYRSSFLKQMMRSGATDRRWSAEPCGWQRRIRRQPISKNN